MSKTIWWQVDHPALVDQTRLPFDYVEVHCQSVAQLAEAIVNLRVRGAPAIGVAAAFGIALAGRLAALEAGEHGDITDAVERACTLIGATRPTAVNLFWAIDRMRRVLHADTSPKVIAEALLDEALAITCEDARSCRSMGEIGAALLDDGMNVLTHCNAGALATAGIGTATAPFVVAHEQGKRIHVYVDETRPLLQGARLTAWELDAAGIPFTVITDNMAAYAMRLGRIGAVFVGADRIAANGDVANKIGTYGVALAARAHNIPFYVVAPTTTVDSATPTGDHIVIEERSPEEVRHAQGHRLIPHHYRVFNPAFDITPSQYVTAIITERGLVRPPYAAGLLQVASGLEETA